MPEGIVTLAQALRHHAEVRPNAPAWWFEGRETSYGAFDEQANRCAQALLAAGVRPGERVALLSKNNDRFWVLLFGAIKIRACLTPINWRLAPPEVAAIFNDSGARLLFVSDEYAAVVPSLVGRCPNLADWIQLEAGPAERQGLDAWLARAEPTDPGPVSNPEDDIIQLYTSGTTGLPKGVRLTHSNFLAHIEGATKSWAPWRSGKTALITSPQFHVAGVNMGLLSLFQGCRAVIVREIRAAELVGLIERERIAYAFLVPAMIATILDSAEGKAADFSALERIAYGASPIAEDLLTRAIARFGCAFSHLYGMTETAGVGAALAPEDHEPKRLRSCGKPYPTAEIRVARPDGTPCVPCDVGEIQLRSRAVMRGYWNRPEDTAAAMTEDGWYRSGDAGYLDAEGFLYIHDRIKDMIVSGGENIYPAEVENAISGHPNVAEVAVIGVPDAKWGEAVKAVVVLRPGAAPDPASIVSWARQRIAGYKIPKSIDFIAALPRNPAGKVLRRELREAYWQGHARRVN
ncbi:MAG TPA: long-chain-fatty-acid--CoA ligase [Stellaceae bacterium]|nr:long-chain-fatty-acid--CoA ligase [Stellaceae bacterium]